MQHRKQDLLMKMVFVGDSGAGKTNLLTRITQNKFHEQHLATIGVEFKIKRYEIDGLTVKVQMWDTAGQERYRSISAPYYRGAGGIVLCYSMNDPASAENLDRWIKEVQLYAEENTQTAIVACKSDLGEAVSPDIINSMIQDKGFKHFVTSSLTGEGVQEAMKTIVTDWTRRMVRQSLQIASQNKGNQRKKERNKGNKLGQQAQQLPDKPKKGCC